MFEYRDRELANLWRLIASGKLTVQKLGSTDSGIFKHVQTLRSKLLDIVMRVRNFGQDQVTDELARQGAEIA